MSNTEKMISVPRELLERCRQFTLYIKSPACLRIDIDAELSKPAEQAAGCWRDGAPEHPWDSEWFLAETVHGEYVALKPLPDDFSYDFTTADGTYTKRSNIKRWAQLSDSSYIEPEKPAEQPQGEPVAWSTVKPTAPGAYWVRGNGLGQEALIQVIDNDGELRCNLHQRTTGADFGWGYAVADLSEDFEWLGPLFTHSDPVEVERLREELTEQGLMVASECRRALAAESERDTLRAQLAEAHALLREGSEWIKANSFGGTDAIDLYDRLDITAGGKG